MKNFKRIVSIALASLIALSAIGCSGEKNHTEKDANGNEIKTINVGVPLAESKLSVESSWLADSLGYFEEELGKVGYKLNVIGFGQGGTAINEALASKQVDYAFMGDLPEVIAVSNGLEIEAIASLSSNSTLGLLVGKNSGIKSVADLKGKKICAAYGTVLHKYLSDILAEAGLTLNDVEVINDLANAATLLATGDADALIYTAAGLYAYEAKGIGDIIVTSRENTDFAAQFFVTARSEYLKENPESAKAIIKALIRAKDYAVANPDEVAGSFATDNIPAPIWQKVYPAEDGFEFFDPKITEQAREKLASLSKFLVANQITTKDINIDQFFNTTYYDEVAKELGID